MVKYAGLALIIGFILDLLLGDPTWLCHPVRLIGKGIARGEKALRRRFPATPVGEMVAGTLLWCGICLLCGIVPWVILRFCFWLHTGLGIAIESFLCYQMLAVRSLWQESMKVYDALKNGTLEDGRQAVSMIVGRDTAELNEVGVVKAAVETVAENFSDGVFAPMFYMILGGPVLLYVYKGINTMDSMLGYKNARYLYFGRCAAKMDDVANFIPSRLAGLCLIAGAWIRGMDWRNSWRIFRRDRKKHASPNSAQTEAAAAGALRVQLAGNAYYFGKLYQKPYIGDPLRRVEVEDILRMNQLMRASAILTLLFCCAGHLLVGLLLSIGG